VQVVPENDMRPARFTGICIGVRRAGAMTRFTVRNAVAATGVVERSFLLHSPFITGITVRRSLPVRRAKLTYLRHRSDAANTFGQ
jgi:large subunit ribosomal protein L19